MSEAPRELMDEAAQWQARLEAEQAARLEALQRLEDATGELAYLKEQLDRRAQEQGWNAHSTIGLRLLGVWLQAQLPSATTSRCTRRSGTSSRP